MRLHEWEAKQRLRAHGVPVPAGAVAHAPEEAAVHAEEIGFPVMVKAQALSGGRGKAGLVRRAGTREAAAGEASSLLGALHEGERVRTVLVEPLAEVAEELFAAITVDDVYGGPVLVLSRHGGVDVEEEAATDDGRTPTIPIDVTFGLRPHMALPAVAALGLGAKPLASLLSALTGCWDTFAHADATMLEVNPLAILADETCVALDAKMTIDDDALYRHPDLSERSPDAIELTGREAAARELGIRYAELGGNVAVLSGGAGMTMAIVDAIHHHGGEAANFVDVMGGIDAASARNLAAVVLEHVETDPSIAALVVNVSLTASPIAPFVEGFEQAFADTPPRVPVFGCVRGTGAAVLSMSLGEARSRLEAIGVRLSPGLEDAIEEAVRASPASGGR